MEATHVVGTGTIRAINLHLPVETIVEHEAVNHRQPVGLHGMTRSVVEVTHFRVIEVRHLLVVAHVEVICATKGLSITARTGVFTFRREKCRYAPHVPPWDEILIWPQRSRNLVDVASNQEG